MTDWIAVLLAEQQAAETTEELPGLGAFALAARRAGERRAGEQREKDGETETALPERDILTARAEDWPSLAEAGLGSDLWAAVEGQAEAAREQAAEERLAGMLGALVSDAGERRMTAPAERGAGALWRALVRGDVALGWRSGERAQTVPEETGAGAMDAGTLDRLVERDSRRYDGGFALY